MGMQVFSLVLPALQTGANLRHKMLLPNNNLRTLIGEWHEANKKE